MSVFILFYSVDVAEDPPIHLLYDNQYLYLSFTTVGSFVQNVGESPVYSPLKAQYFMYFGVGNNPSERYLVNLGDGSSVNVEDFSQIGKLYHDANQDLFGSGLQNTYDSTGGSEAVFTDGFESEISSAAVYSRSNGVNTIEMALNLASVGLSRSQVADLGFLYFGAATSNPSGPGDLFANDEFGEAPGQGQEFDTLGAITILQVPEPSSAMLSAAALVLMLARRRRILASWLTCPEHQGDSRRKLANLRRLATGQRWTMIRDFAVTRNGSRS